MFDGNLHVTPEGDLREHVLSLSCWCRPTPCEEDSQLIVHHAMDQRERYETGELKLQ
jgi:hypothetical protein